MKNRSRNILFEIFTRGDFAKFKRDAKDTKDVSISEDGFTRTFVPKSAVAICYNENRDLLMGTSLADDDRYGKLCFVGGGVDPGEDPKYAIARECFEESGVVMFLDPLEIKYNSSNPAVVFGTGKAISGNINHNDEFSDMRWYSKEEIEQSNYSNVYEPNIELLKIFWQDSSI